MRIRFILSQAAQGIWRNLAMAVAVILVTFVSLLLVGSGALLQMQVAQMKTQWYDKIEISIFMCAEGDPERSCNGKEADAAQIESVRETLENAELKPFIEKFYYQTKQEAYEEFQEQFGDTALGPSAQQDMMPASFRIKLVNPQEYRIIEDTFAGKPGVQSIYDQRKILEPLFNILNKATLVSLGLAGVMIAAAVLLITVTIKISAMSREKETGIMRLVGASDVFIQLPFMLEGAFSALVGALLASGTLWAGVHFLVQGWLRGASLSMSLIGTNEVLLVSILLVGAAILLAVFSSLFSISRYTKV